MVVIEKHGYTGMTCIAFLFLSQKRLYEDDSSDLLVIDSGLCA
jgi:hypothetical protein